MTHSLCSITCMCDSTRCMLLLDASLTQTHQASAHMHTISLHHCSDLIAAAMETNSTSHDHREGLTDLKPFLAVADCLRRVTTKALGIPLQLDPASTSTFTLPCCSDAPDAVSAGHGTQVGPLISVQYLTLYCVCPGRCIHGPL